MAYFYEKSKNNPALRTLVGVLLYIISSLVKLFAEVRRSPSTFWTTIHSTARIDREFDREG